MNYQFIETNTEKGICRIELNRPEKHNALHAGLIAELNRVFNVLAKDESVKFVVLGGKGKAFCSGADLCWFEEATKLSEKENRVQFELLAKMLRKLHNLPQVTIALAKGKIFGGGIGLLSACDFVLMDESTTLAFTEVHLGLVPATILPFVATRIPRQQSRKLILTGKPFSSDEALRIGLADSVFAAEKLENGLQELLADLQKPASGAVLASKKLINDVYSGDIKTDDYELTARVLYTRIATDEAKSRIEKFIKKKR